jgi:hypothetical protein
MVKMNLKHFTDFMGANTFSTTTLGVTTLRASIVIVLSVAIRLCRPPDGVTSHKYKLLPSLTTIISFTKSQTH